MKDLQAKGKNKRNAALILIIAYISHYVYYFSVFNKTYSEVRFLVWISLVALTLGYFVGSKYQIVLSRHTVIRLRGRALSYKKQKMAGIALVLIGIFSHIFFYRSHSFGSYAEGYGVTRGNGYITVFFNFWLVGMVIIEYLTENKLIDRKLKWFNRLLMLIYSIIYFVVLTKRRQIIILFLALLGIWKDKFSRFQKAILYCVGIALILVFSVFGKIRGYVDSNGLVAGLSYAISNFSKDWISLEQFEGRFISRTLNDIYYYVSQFGHDPSILLGVLFCMVPRKLLGGTKPLAFPEWYTKHFYINDYLRGVGYAGSMVAELYLIGGLFVLIFGYLTIGYICARIQKYRKQGDSIKETLIYSLFLYTIVILPRYDLASLLIDVVFMYFPIIWFCGGVHEGENGK